MLMIRAPRPRGPVVTEQPGNLFRAGETRSMQVNESQHIPLGETTDAQGVEMSANQIQIHGFSHKLYSWIWGIFNNAESPLLQCY